MKCDRHELGISLCPAIDHLEHENAGGFVGHRASGIVIGRGGGKGKGNVLVGSDESS